MCYCVDCRNVRRMYRIILMCRECVAFELGNAYEEIVIHPGTVQTKLEVSWYDSTCCDVDGMTDNSCASYPEVAIM